MTSMQDAVASAARSLIGVRFRPQGRDPDHGLDCVGVVVVALASAGHAVRAPRDYTLRGGDPQRVGREMAASGLERIDDGSRRPGDILLMQSGPMQLHLGIRTAEGIVQADAGLRRVVETPGASRWPVLRAWRIGEVG